MKFINYIAVTRTVGDGTLLKHQRDYNGVGGIVTELLQLLASNTSYCETAHRQHMYKYSHFFFYGPASFFDIFTCLENGSVWFHEQHMISNVTECRVELM